jgi:hypothetical protein
MILVPFYLYGWDGLWKYILPVELVSRREEGGGGGEREEEGEGEGWRRRE